MQPVFQAVVASWSIPPAGDLRPGAYGADLLARCMAVASRRISLPAAMATGKLRAGLFSLWFALASPLDTFGPFVLTAHMLQHMMLMMVAPPLILLGEPLIPIVRGMPRFAAREFAGPFLNWRLAQRVGLALTNPVVALLLMGAVMFAWHVPALYELALRSSSWHEVEHACFFFASIIFWWPVIQPWPSRAQWPRWAMVPYLMIADLQNTALSAVLVFSDKILYPSYAAGPSLFGFTPQEDQAAAGATMWVVGSLAFIIPAVLTAIQCLSRTRPFQKSLEAHGLVSGHDFSRADKPSIFVIPRGLQPAGDLLSRLFQPGTLSKRRNFQLASFLILFALTAAGFAALSGLSSDDDDQVLRASQPAGPFTVGVYGPAGDIAVGPATFSALVQDRNTHEVLLDSEVDFAQSNPNTQDVFTRRVRASRENENKLLFTTDVDFDSSGSRVLAIEVRQAGRSGILSLPVEVLKSDAGSSLRWSYIVILTFAGALCAVYLWRHRVARSGELTVPLT